MMHRNHFSLRSGSMQMKPKQCASPQRVMQNFSICSFLWTHYAVIWRGEALAHVLLALRDVGEKQRQEGDVGGLEAGAQRDPHCLHRPSAAPSAGGQADGQEDFHHGEHHVGQEVPACRGGGEVEIR